MLKLISGDKVDLELYIKPEASHVKTNMCSHDNICL